jgi:hypothetical protein
MTFSGQQTRCTGWLLRLLASKLHIFAQKKRGHVAPLSGSSVTDLYYVSMPSNHTLFSNIFSK